MKMKKQVKTVWHVTVGGTIHNFSKKQTAKAFAKWILGDESQVWCSKSE